MLSDGKAGNGVETEGIAMGGIFPGRRREIFFTDKSPSGDEIARCNMATYDLPLSDVKTIKNNRNSPPFSRIMTSGSEKPDNRSPIRRDWGGTPERGISLIENIPMLYPSRQHPETPHRPHAQISPHRALLEFQPVRAVVVDSRLGPDPVPVENVPKYRPVCQNLPGNDLAEGTVMVFQSG